MSPQVSAGRPPSRELTHQPAFALERWRVEPARLVLVQAGAERRLEPRVMTLLVALAEADGEVLSRARLLETAWPDAVVGDEALTMAVSKLRRALGRRGDGGDFIETIPRVGYRLRVAAQSATARENEPNPAPKDASPDAKAEAGPTLAPTGEESATPHSPTFLRRLLVAGPALLALATGLVLVAGLVLLTGLVLVTGLELTQQPSVQTSSLVKLPGSVTGNGETLPRPRGLTALAGFESQATLDPTARRVAFLRRSETESGLFVLDLQSLRQAEVYRGEVVSPAWSPLDQRIAFIRHAEDRVLLSIVSSSGGEVEDLAEVVPSPHSGIDWSPDARRLAWSDYDADRNTNVLREIDLTSAETRYLTDPPAGRLGDGRPTYSPDGRYLAFNRADDLHSMDLWLLDRETLEVRRWTHDGARIWGLDWLADSSGVIFSSNRAGPFQLWTLALGADEPTWLPLAGDQVRFPDVHKDVLVYDAFEIRAELSEVHDDGSHRRLDALSSKARESAPALSPDGRLLAFASNRSGSAEVWLRDDGGGLRRVSELGASLLVGMAFSPDASSLLVHAVIGNKDAVCLLEVRSGECRRLRQPPGLVVLGPAFGPDGRSVRLATDATGRFEVYRVELDAQGPAEPQAVTDFGALAMRFDDDGTPWVLTEGAPYVLTGHAAQLLRQEPDGSWRSAEIDGFAPAQSWAWTLSGGALHALQNTGDGSLVWRRWPLDGGAWEDLATLPPRLENGGFAVHPSGRSAIVARLLPMESDLHMMPLAAAPSR
ncbi:MAG: winged helix-turn-helix domain-containing protein [Acidobacteriota bacterium]